MALPLFPKLTPRVADPAWLNIDQPYDDECELAQMERDHQTFLNSVSQKNNDLIPIGKTQAEPLDDEEDDDEEDNDDDDESETHDEEDEDEIEMDVSQERSSPVDVSIRMVQGHSVR